MFRNWFSGDFQACYLQPRQKPRIDHVGNWLVKKRYSPVLVRQYLHEWCRFVLHLEKKKLPVPTSIHDSHIQSYLRKNFSSRSHCRQNGVRTAIRVFLEMDANGNFARCIQFPPQKTNTLYAEVVPSYLKFVRHHLGISKKTAGNHDYRLRIFTNYLERVGIKSWRRVQASVVRAFLTTQLPGRKAGTRLCYACTFRTFCRWAYLEGMVERDLSPAIAAVRQYRLVGIPDVLTDAELSAILRSPDRKTAIGKRDYAILLLAARYGIRPSDIQQLTFDHINWRSRQIVLRQTKTGNPLLLPLLQDVLDALVDYLQKGRPQTESRNVFVRHHAPYEPFSTGSTLATIMEVTLHRAGLGERAGRKGFGLLRHTLATRMLSNECSIKAISDVLGHVSASSTLVYTKVDVSHLKTVALTIKELLR